MKHIPKKQTPILIVDDDTSHLLSIRAILKDSEIPEPALVSDSREVLSLLREHHFPFVLLDLMMPHISGMELLQQIKTEFPHTECVILTAMDDTASAVKAMKFGAYDYITKPFSRDKIIILITRALELYYLKHGLSLFENQQTFNDLKNPDVFKKMVATDDSMARVFHQVEAVAATDYSVIISGASGTGKEMLARAIHESSPRCGRPFLAVNMGAFSSTLFEREFFGHEKGAYTGASDKKQGFFEAANGGTLFMDEITDLELPRQGVLLRTLQEREIYPLGSTEPKKVDVRILAATNRDIAEEVTKGNFRADLYHRLNMYSIKIPLLKERRKDIIPLANHFLHIYAHQNEKKIIGLSQNVEHHLTTYSFPGNIRELENIIAAAVLSEQSDVLTLSAFGEQSPLLSETEQIQYDDLPPLEVIEKQYIAKVLSATDENRTQAAKILGIGLRTLQRKLKKYHTRPL